MPHAGLTLVLVALVAASAAAPRLGGPPEPAAPKRCDVRFALAPAACLGAGGDLTREVREAFRIDGVGVGLKVQFLDTPSLGLDRAGWTVRQQLAEGGRAEIVFRRRYPVLDSPAAALRRAADDGFHAGEIDFDASVEWGESARAVCFTRTKALGPPGARPTGLPGAEDARTLALGEMPGKLNLVNRPGWAATALAEARVFGPVSGRHWDGRLAGGGEPVRLDVWEVGPPEAGPAFLAELTCPTGLDGADATRAGLRKVLADRRWLATSDRPLPQRVFERYR